MRFAACLVLIVVACGTSSQAAESRGNESQRADYLRGFDQGYRESYAPAYVSAYNDGLWEGRSEGYNAGFNPTYDALFQQSFDRAQPIGYERAYGATFELGQRLGAAVVEELRAQGGMTGADYTIWADNFGSTGDFGGNTGNPASVPEPSSLALAVAALGALCLGMRRARS